MLDFHECCDFAPRVYAAHPDLASSSPRPKALWLVTGSEVSKQGIFFTVLGGGGLGESPGRDPLFPFLCAALAPQAENSISTLV